MEDRLVDQLSDLGEPFVRVRDGIGIDVTGDVVFDLERSRAGLDSGHHGLLWRFDEPLLHDPPVLDPTPNAHRRLTRDGRRGPRHLDLAFPPPDFGTLTAPER